MRQFDALIAGFSIASVAAALALATRLRIAIFELQNEHPLRGMSRIGTTPLNARPVGGDVFDGIAISRLESRGVLVHQHMGEFLGYDPGSHLCSYQPDFGDETLAAPCLIAGSCGCTPDLLRSLRTSCSLRGFGFSSCAWSDGPSYRGRHVVVLGSGHWAVDQARTLLRYTDSVTVLEDSGHPDQFPPVPQAEFDALGASYLRVPSVTALESQERGKGLRVRGVEGLDLACEAIFYAPDLVPAWPRYLAVRQIAVDGSPSLVGVESGVAYYDHYGLYEQGTLGAEVFLRGE